MTIQFRIAALWTMLVITVGIGLYIIRWVIMHVQTLATTQGRIEFNLTDLYEHLCFFCPKCRHLYELGDCYLVYIPGISSVNIMCPRCRAESYLGRIKVIELLR